MNLDNVKNPEETWNAIAKSFDTTRHKPWQQCIDFIVTLPQDCIVADVACGNGRHTIPAAKHCKKVIALDFSKELLNIVNKKLEEENIKNVVLQHADVTNIPLETNTVDAAMFMAALHNIQGQKNRVKALKEVKRILKPDGLALISVWSRWQDKYCKQFFKKWFKTLGQGEFGDIDIFWRQHGLNIPRFYHLYSKREFISDLRQSGFKIEQIQAVKMHSTRYADNYFAFVR